MFNPPSAKKSVMKSPILKSALLILGFLAAAITPSAFAQTVSGTWANPADVTGTLTSAGTGGLYTYSGSDGALVVGDTILAKASAGGLTNNDLYYVVAVTSGTYTLSTSPGGSAITGAAAGTAVIDQSLPTWGATAADELQGGPSWTGGVVPSGADAIATIASASDLNPTMIIQGNVTVGTINVTENSNQWGLVSSNLGTNATLAALTFATTSATPAGPSINTSSNSQLARLGFGDTSFHQGMLKISGTQGLTLILGSGGMRILSVDWSGFTNGAGGMGTLTLQQGLATNAGFTNPFGAGAGSINVTIGNSSSPSGATAPELNLSSAGITVNNLNGTVNARISGAQTLTIGAGNGTNTDFLGIIGQTAAGVNSSTNLLKSGSGIQTISGQIVGTTATVTVSGAGGALVLNGSNSYGGATTVTSGTLRATNAYAFGVTSGVSIASTGILDLRSDSPVTFDGVNGTGIAISGSGATINVDHVTSAGTGQTITVGPLTINSTVSNAQTIFTGADNTSLSTGAVTNVTAAAGTTEITNNISGGGSLTLSSFADTRTGAATVQFDGAGNTTVTGAITQTGTTALTYAGSGTLTLGGSNSYTGVTTITGGGTLSVSSLAIGGSISNIGASSNSASNLILNGGTLSYTGTSVTIDRGFTYSSVNGGTIAVTNAATNLTITGLAAQSTVGASSLTKTGAGTLTLSGTGDTSSFGLIVDAGEVDLNDSGPTGAGRVITRNGVIINGGGIVKITGTNGDQIQNSQVVTVNNGTFNMNGKSETAGNLTIGDGADNGIIIGGSGSTYTNGNGGTGTFNAESGSVDVNLAGAGAVLNKTTSGTVTLSQANSYTGATNVTGGTLIVSGSLTGTASVNLDPSILEVTGSIRTAAAISSTNSTVQGSGVVGAVTLTSTSALQPGYTTAGGGFVANAALTAGNVTFSDTASTLNIGIGLASSGTDATQLISKGTVTLNDTPLNLTLGSFINNAALAAANQVYIIINGGATLASGIGAGSDQFATGNTYSLNGFQFNVLYGYDPATQAVDSGGTDVALELTAIPEPGSWAMLLGGLGMLTAWQTKRRRRWCPGTT
jgi:autotransporter-associated beta strand protein